MKVRFFSSFQNVVSIVDLSFVVNRYLRLINVEATFMMPNHRDVPYNTIKICLIKPLIVKANQREAQMADELKCIVFRTMYRWTTIGKQLW